MKRILFVALATVLLASCGGNSYKINGEIMGVEDGTVITLSVLDFDGLDSLNSVAVKNGKFSFKGQTDTAQVAVVTFDMDDAVRGCQFYLERGDIKIMIDTESGNQFLAGTPNNDAFQKFYDDTEVFNEEANELEDKIRMTLATDGDASDLYSQMGDLQDRFTALLAQSIEDNADKIYGYQQLVENYSLFEPEQLMDLIEKLAPSFGQDIVLLQLTAMTQAQLATSLGHQYIDFEAQILDKKYGFDDKVSLSQYVQGHKVVLLDFWASWCTPCINEIPNIKAAYKKFKSKGFEVVSVSVDDDTDAWIKAVKDNGMNWIQLWNGEEMQNSAAVKYSISAIPSSFLIDADGTIIGRNLRDKELEEALEDYFSRN